MPKLRICTVEFSENTKIQIGGAVKTKKSGDSINIIDLGKEESFGKLHMCGVISEDIINVTMVKTNIDKLENYGPNKRLEWFQSNFPKARIVKIEDDKIFDRLKDTKEDGKPAVFISNAVELKWNK